MIANEVCSNVVISIKKPAKQGLWIKKCTKNIIGMKKNKKQDRSLRGKERKREENNVTCHTNL